MLASRSSDDRAREMEAQHAAAIIAKDTFIAKLEDAKDQTIRRLESSVSKSEAIISKMEAALVKLEAENAALKAQAESRLAEILTVVRTGDPPCALRRPPVRRAALRPRAAAATAAATAIGSETRVRSGMAGRFRRWPKWQV
jgi:septum formation inhibitor MinC